MYVHVIYACLTEMQSSVTSIGYDIHCGGLHGVVFVTTFANLTSGFTVDSATCKIF